MTTPPYEPELANVAGNSPPAIPAPPPTAAASVAAPRRTALKVGDAESITRQITQADINAFAAVSGDNQRLHLDASFAAGTRFGGIVAHGMLTGAIFSALLGTQLPGEGTILLGMNLNFAKPVFPGDIVCYRAEIISITGRGRMEVQLTATKAGGILTASATATVIYRS